MDGTKLSVYLGDFVEVHAYGTQHALAGIGEQLAWLGAACRASPYEGIAICYAKINAAPSGFVLDFGFEDISSTRQTQPNGSCWHPLFRNPVIARGFPIATKAKPDIGLEIALDMMAALVQSQSVTTFNGKLFIKGFSSMLTPTKHCGDKIIWHLTYKLEGRVSCLDHEVSGTENVSMEDLEKSRHVVG